MGQINTEELQRTVAAMRAELNMPNIGIGIDTGAGEDQTMIFLTDTRQPAASTIIGHVEPDGSTVTIHDEFRAELIETANSDVLELRGYGLNDTEIAAYMQSVGAAMAAGAHNFAEALRSMMVNYDFASLSDALRQIQDAVRMIGQDDSDGEPTTRPEIADPVQRRHSNRLERSRGRAYESRRRHDIPAPRNMPRRR